MSTETIASPKPIPSHDVPWTEWSDVPRFAVRYKYLSLAAMGESYQVGVAIEELGPGKFEIVAPSVSILAEPPVAVVDKVAGKHGTRPVAEAYLQYLYTEVGQEIAAKNFYRPRLASVAAKYRSRFPEIELITVDGVFGGWKKANSAHFADGALFDQIYQPGR